MTNTFHLTKSNFVFKPIRSLSTTKNLFPYVRSNNPDRHSAWKAVTRMIVSLVKHRHFEPGEINEKKKKKEEVARKSCQTNFPINVTGVQFGAMCHATKDQNRADIRSKQDNLKLSTDRD